jgi:hypothetical protein
MSVDEKTPDLELWLPHVTNNPRAVEVPRLRENFMALDDAVGGKLSASGGTMSGSFKIAPAAGASLFTLDAPSTGQRSQLNWNQGGANQHSQFINGDATGDWYHYALGILSVVIRKATGIVEFFQGINMNAKKITNLGAGVAATDAVRVDQLDQFGTAIGVLQGGKLDKAGGVLTGPVTASLTTEPATQWLGVFSGDWRSHFKEASTTAVTDAGARATSSFTRKSTGSGVNGPSHTDCAVFMSSEKSNYLTTTVLGEIDVLYLTATQGRYDDLGGMLIDLTKVGGVTGGTVAVESAVGKVNSSGVHSQRIQSIVNFQEGAGGVSADTGYGFHTRADVGAPFSAFHADTQSGASWQNTLSASTLNVPGNMLGRIDGTFRGYLSPGSPTLPGHSFQGDPDTGMYRVGADQIAWSTAGGARWGINAAGHLISMFDGGLDIGSSAGGRVRQIFATNPTISTSDARTKEIIEPVIPDNLAFINALTPRTYTIKDGGSFQEWHPTGEMEEYDDPVLGPDGEPDVTLWPLYDKAGELVFDNHPVLNENGEPVIDIVHVQESVPVLGPDGRPNLLFVPDLDAAGNQLYSEVPIFDAQNAPMRDEVGNPLFTRVALGVERAQAQVVLRIVEKQRIQPRVRMGAFPVTVKRQRPVVELVKVAAPGSRPHTGLIAQEVKAVIDAQGIKDLALFKLADKDDPESLNMLAYEELLAPMVGAIKQLTARVVELESAK